MIDRLPTFLGIFLGFPIALTLILIIVFAGYSLGKWLLDREQAEADQS